MDNIQHIPVTQITPNPMQPRTVFDQAELAQLADSIKERGLTHPILVEPDTSGNYILVAGERRLRAHKMLDLTHIQAIVRLPSSDESRLIDATVENVQRHNMNVVDEAHAYKKMRDDFKFSVREISKKVGVYEARIHTLLKITLLEPDIQHLIAEGSLPGSDEAIKALLTVKPGKLRIELAQALSARSATIKMITIACRKINANTIHREPALTKTPAISVAYERIAPGKEKLPDWNALKQSGKVPPWELLVTHIENTCDNCALRNVASKSTCGDCPLVDMIRRLMENTNVKSN